jgi:calcineurin-like phosphoesterase family protein
VLIRGNHDRKVESWLMPGDEVHDSLMMGGVYMAHVPPGFEAYEKRDRKGHDLPTVLPVPVEAEIMLCGHVHESWKKIMHGSLPILNVGVDVRGYSPLTLEELRRDL